MKHGIFYGGMLLLAAGATMAQTPSQLVTTSKKVIIESVTTVAVGTYQPARPVVAVTRTNARYDSPEDAATALLSAMAAGDYEWWLSIWSAESRDMMSKRYQESGRKPADIAANWRGILTERPAVLVGKAEYGRQRAVYALVRYRTSGSQMTVTVPRNGNVTNLGAQAFENTLSFKATRGRWEAVQDLSTDPVFHASGLLWDDTKTEIRISRPGE